MNRLVKAGLLVAAAHLGIPFEALSQSPAGPVLRVWEPPASPMRHQYTNSIAMRPDGGFTVIWDETHDEWLEEGALKLLLRSFSVEDEAFGEPLSLASARGHRHDCCFGGTIAGNQASNLVLAFTQGHLKARRFGFEDGPLAFELSSSEGSFLRWWPQVAIDSRGELVVVWQSQGQEKPDVAVEDGGIFGRLVDSGGNPVGPEFHVNTVRRGEQGEPSVSMSAQTGAFVVVWQSNPTGSDAQVAGQLFAPGGARTGGEFRLGSVMPWPWFSHPKVAMAPDGTFVVVWQEPDFDNPCEDYVRIFGQRFTATGQPLGPQLFVNEGFPQWLAFPQIAMDAWGNFAITWTPMGRLYRANGVPVGPPILLIRDHSLDTRTALAFGWNGTFAIAWTKWNSSFEGSRSFARRFSASPGDEPCMFREGVLACDTGRTGGVAEVRHPFGGGVTGDVGLLGDIDGDGRADPCIFRGGRFLCDTGHDYGLAETKVRFGQNGDTPLLGDIDADGRADPCVVRSVKLLCDTAHDGGAPELEVAAGKGGDIPLLGDIDHNGRADLCLFRAGRFLCDTNLDGAPEAEISFGRPGDVPLLMDYDADGTVEPCVYRGRELLCDTGHDGGLAEAVLVFGEGNGTPMAGNLDGL